MTNLHSKIVVKAPFNSLSFGQVAFNLAKAIYRSDRDAVEAILPIGNTVDLSAYKVDREFASWMSQKMNSPFSRITRDMPTLQLWHLQGSQDKPTDNSYLYTFHELDNATVTEKMICGLHDKVFVSSAFSRSTFDLSNVSNIPIGLDPDIVETGKEYLGKDIIHFGLIGKWESRKNTTAIIKTWLRLFGNNKKYRLTCLVENPFLKTERYQSLVMDATGGKDFFNITFLPRLKTNAEVLELYNAIDVDLSGLSSAEGWNLPAFNATALGKWSCVAAHTSHLDWATNDNAIIIHPTGKRPVYDGTFFAKGLDFNQGNIYIIDENDIERAILASVSKAKTPNESGKALRETFTYDRMWKEIKAQIL